MFLNSEEMFTHIYSEIVGAISQENELNMTISIQSAIGEAKGYMSRYDTSVIFNLLGEDRDPILLMYIKDMAVWHFIPLGNGGIDLDFRKTRYEAAIKWLTNVQTGKVVPEGWPLKEPVEQQSFFQFGSNPRRQSHY